MRTCIADGCPEALAANNTTGYCNRFHRIEAKKVSRRRSVGAHRMDAEKWLADVGLTDSPDPYVGLLRSSSNQLDDLEVVAFPDMSSKQKLDAVRAAQDSVAKYRKALQVEVDRADSAAKRRRHQLLYAGLAAQTLGFVDPTLLSDTLRDRIAEELKEQHGIDLAIYEPIT